jgi:hypothetical protein
LNTIIKITVAIAILLIITSAIISLSDMDNEIKSDGITENNTVKKEPGFEAVFVIVGLLAVVWLVLWRKNG